MNIQITVKVIFSCCLTLFLATTAVLAETSSADPAYPGEIKETKNGKQVKLWSTKGPVPVSQASEPFETEREKSIPENTFINVDGIRQNIVRPQIQNQREHTQQKLPFK